MPSYLSSLRTFRITYRGAYIVADVNQQGKKRQESFKMHTIRHIGMTILYFIQKYCT